ncbi:M28 family metallopeptidase [Vulcaniibacterium tengchongense]|uniref:Zn-dependent M28 family amino/carboxypeptidase n=1 Tax=Vulcaniibacterium tengchongense TaxID=1273429 RepID=A0A3N4V8F3_9GAMM|nr:M28 family metallopeptidase [Vulcaniibacterium tengchongense]RPE75971.1 Zn-dependent M28 family amino/carboxypeptidase [Vulcaniibacterium tengchongense]
MSRNPLLAAAALGAFALAACSQQQPEAEAPAAPAPSATAAAGDHAFSPAINAADFAQHVKVLASDAFEGRAPGSAGEEKTVEYLAAQFQRMGLKPGNGDSYFQTVPMVETTADESTVLKLDVKGQPRELKFGTDMVVGTRTGQPEVKVDGSELVFVGYGVNAPEQHWNDYAGVDVKGKTVVMFVNDPGFHNQDARLFEGRRMTYYGRWTYKFEEAARQGAAAALIIHDNEGASYGWDVVKNSWSGAQFDLPAKDDPEPRLPVQGWITGDVARKLLADLGQDLDALYQAAGKPGFKAIPLQAKLSVDLKSTISEKSSRNVVARLDGAKRPDEAIVYMAHWDHLGNHGHEGHGEGAPAGGDQIYNGAVDNATGVAGILEIAEAFSKQTPPPDRSLLFLAVTLEESGLLGSKYYVAHPTVPLNKTVAVVNLDAMPVIGRARDMTVVGYGSSELEDILKTVADGQGRTLHAEATPEDGFYFRSDHFNFAKAGVPALYAKGGDDLVEGGTAAGQKAQADYRDNRYHKPSDEFDPNWQLEGVVQDLEALYGVGKTLAGNEQWPNWYEGNAFRAAHDKLRQSAQ